MLCDVLPDITADGLSAALYRKKLCPPEFVERRCSAPECPLFPQPMVCSPIHLLLELQPIYARPDVRVLAAKRNQKVVMDAPRFLTLKDANPFLVSIRNDARPQTFKALLSLCRFRDVLREREGKESNPIDAEPLHEIRHIQGQSCRRFPVSAGMVRKGFSSVLVAFVTILTRKGRRARLRGRIRPIPIAAGIHEARSSCSWICRRGFAFRPPFPVLLGFAAARIDRTDNGKDCRLECLRQISPGCSWPDPAGGTLHN